PAVGIQGHAVGEPERVLEVVAELLRGSVQDAHSGHSRRAGLSRSGGTGPTAFHRTADEEGAVEAAAVSRRGALDRQATELGALVQPIPGLDRRVDEIIAALRIPGGA